MSLNIEDDIEDFQEQKEAIMSIGIPEEEAELLLEDMGYQINNMQELIEMQKETNELLKTLLAEVKEAKEIWKQIK